MMWLAVEGEPPDRLGQRQGDQKRKHMMSLFSGGGATIYITYLATRQEEKGCDVIGSG